MQSPIEPLSNRKPGLPLLDHHMRPSYFAQKKLSRTWSWGVDVYNRLCSGHEPTRRRNTNLHIVPSNAIGSAPTVWLELLRMTSIPSYRCQWFPAANLDGFHRQTSVSEPRPRFIARTDVIWTTQLHQPPVPLLRIRHRMKMVH